MLESANGNATHALGYYDYYYVYDYDRLRLLCDEIAFVLVDVEMHHEDYTVLAWPIPYPSVHEKRQTPNASCNEITPYTPA